MKVLLDCSPAKILEYRNLYQFDFGQLRTPLTNYALAPQPIVWAADNGFFKKRDVQVWLNFINRFDENRERRPLFVTLPDIVGDAPRTVELFHAFKLRTNELPRALVIQDGIERTIIPWDDLDAVFIGGTDAFKISKEAFAVARTAKILGKHIHIGRVNTPLRVQNWILDVETNEPLAHTIDGSGISMFDHMLEAVLLMIQGQHPQKKMELG